MAKASGSTEAGRPASPLATRAIAVGLFLLTFLVFAPAWRHDFVNYDDPDYVTNNAQVKSGLTAESVRWALTARVASNWHPLTWMSHELDATLFGMNPHGHHATSIFLHALNAMLAFLALRKLTGRLLLSAMCAALFAWHPLRAESVAWVAERKDVLSGLCFFLCLWLYASYVGRRARGARAVGSYLGTLVTCGLGLAAKPMLVTLPFLLLVLDFWPLRRWGSAVPPGKTREPLTWLALEKLPFLALAIGSSRVTYLVQRDSGAVTTALPLTDRLANALVSVPRYLGKALWPAELAALYPHPAALRPGTGGWAALQIFAAAAFLVVVSVLVWWQRRNRPWLLVGWLWFIGMLVPVIGIVQVGLQSMADRYTYLPILGVEIALGWTCAELIGFQSARPTSGTSRTRAIGLAAAATLAFAVATSLQARVWRNSITLFEHTLAVAPDGNYLAHDNLGIALADAGRIDEAIAQYEAALAINPTYPNAHNNFGKVLADRGQLGPAIAHYRAAIAARPGMLEVYNNLGNALADAGQVDEAMLQYQHVLQQQPDHLNAHNGYAITLAMKGRVADAERELRAVLRQDPGNLSAMSNLGNVCAMQGKREEAAAFYQRVLERQPDDSRTHFNYGNVLSELGRNPEAVEQLRRATRLAPNDAEAHAALGTVLSRIGQRTEATRELQIALQLRPGFGPAQAALDALARTPVR